MYFKASKSAFKKTLSTIHIYVGLELSKWLTCIPPADQSELSLHRTIYGYLFRQNIRWSFFCSKEFYKKTKTKNGKGMWKVNRVLQGSPLFMDWVVANHLRPGGNFCSLEAVSSDFVLVWKLQVSAKQGPFDQWGIYEASLFRKGVLTIKDTVTRTWRL